MKVEVTKRDIQKGEPGSCRKCPVALAIARATRHKKPVLVTLHCADVSDKLFALPRKAQRFIARFDMGLGKVKPFSFNLGRAYAL